MSPLATVTEAGKHSLCTVYVKHTCILAVERRKWLTSSTPLRILSPDFVSTCLHVDTGGIGAGILHAWWRSLERFLLVLVSCALSKVLK